MQELSYPVHTVCKFLELQFSIKHGACDEKMKLFLAFEQGKKPKDL